MKVKFCGAARIVTGSCYHLDIKGKEYLVDCGMFQGRKETTKKNYEPFLFNPKKITAVFLTHAHIDHSGLIPKLYNQGFRGKIYATSTTVDLCKIMLEDSAHIQEMDGEHENRRRQRQGLEPRKPLYGKKDAEQCMKLFKRVKYDTLIKIADNLNIRFRDAGHILGSSIIQVFVNEDNQEKKIVFSGDLGQWDVPIVKDPTYINEADYLFIESTYGDRLHERVEKREDQLLYYINDVIKKGGKLLIPSFAIERTQEILYAFNKLIHEKRFPKIPVFLDSPLAIRATEVFKKHIEDYDQEARHKYKNIFDFPQLKYLLTAQQSMELNDFAGPCIIIAGSGMMTAGRIRHHLKHGLWDKKNTVLVVGYQAEGTLGRRILEGDKTVKMMGMEITVGADVNKINSFSAHADYEDMLEWLSGFEKKPKKVFIVHGEEKSGKSLQLKIKEKGFKNSMIPRIGDVVEL